MAFSLFEERAQKMNWVGLTDAIFFIFMSIKFSELSLQTVKRPYVAKILKIKFLSKLFRKEQNSRFKFLRRV